MSPNRIEVYQRAAPIILANATVPLLAVADTAVMGYFGTTQELAALAIINSLFSMMFWGFGFLRMSTSGFIAQASGGDSAKLQILMLRALLIALFGALILLLFQAPILTGGLQIFHTSVTMNSLIADYFYVRILGAPATLMLYCVTGTLIGLGKSKWLLYLQVQLNVINIGFNLIFVLYFQMGLKGLALGTVIAEYLTLAVGLWLIHHSCFPLFNRPWDRHLRKRIFVCADWFNLFTVNRDIFIRTLFLLLSFFWFTSASAQYGELTLASNQILLTIISFSAFFLDGFAFVAEAEVGRAYGLKQTFKLRHAVKITTEAAAVCALALGTSIYLLDQNLVALFTNKPEVIQEVCAYLPFAALYVVLSFAAFQLDGIFIGATAAKFMRNASIVSFVCFIASYYLLTYIYGREGLWLSFVAYVVYRAIALGCYYPKLLQNAYGQ